MSVRNLAVIAGVGLVASATAHADPITDFKIGTTVYIRSGSVTVDGYTHSTGGVPLSKPPSSLNLDVDASALGIELPIVLHLTGTKLSSSVLQFTFDESFAGSGVLLGDGLHLTRAQGTILTSVSYVPGATAAVCSGAACLGNVFVDVITPLSTIQVHGDFGDMVVAINHARVIGGVATPRLKAFYYAGDPVCSKTTPTTAYLSIRLAGPSPSPGTQVVLHSAFPAGVAVPLIQQVPAGKDSTAVTATIAPGFFGTVHIAAAAGGALGFLDLEVDHEHDCDPPKHKKQWVALNPDLGCIQCTQLIARNNEGDDIRRVSRVAQVVLGGTTVLDPLAIVPGATAVTVDALANNGTVAGSMTVNGVTQAYRANLRDGIGAVQALGAFTVRGVNQFGTVVGNRTSAGVSTAVYDAGRGLTAIPVRGASTSTVTSVNDNGVALGTYTNAAGATRGFRYAGGSAASDLPLVGTAPVVPIAENDLGQLLGLAALSGGGSITVVVSPSGTVTRVPAPAGFTSFVARSINRAGRLVGTATTTSGLARALMWNPTSGFVPLTDYIPGLVATDALSINDGDEIVVRGTINGRTDLYVVSL